MKIEKKDLEKNSLELTIEVSEKELKPFLENAAKKLSKKTKIPGFRPGKAPYETIKTSVGEMNIYQEDLNNVRKETQLEIINSQKIHKKILDFELNISQKNIDSLLDKVLLDFKFKKENVLSNLDNQIQILTTQIEKKLSI